MVSCAMVCSSSRFGLRAGLAAIFLYIHACKFLSIACFVGWDFRLQFQAFTVLFWVDGVVRLGCLSIRNVCALRICTMQWQ